MGNKYYAVKTVNGKEIDGDTQNPRIYCQCKRCNTDLCFSYEKLKVSAGHNCSAVISSGEFAVQEFLKTEKIGYKVQRDTLNCKNPKTGYQLPYDFELSRVKLIIEVQGEQHDKFIERFHGTIENFEYGQWKDKVKKEFAIQNGYAYLEIRYPEIKDGSFRTIIKKRLDELGKSRTNR